MRNALLLLLAFVAGAASSLAGTSTLTAADGYACMGDDKSRKQTEAEALANARRNAVEFAAVHIRSQAEYRDTLLQKDLLQAFAAGSATILEVIESGWYQDPRSGDCYRLKVRAEVVPDEVALEKAAQGKPLADEPTAPLQVKVWTDKPEYQQGEFLKVYLRANKPFHGRVVYLDAAGQPVQLLPNPHRSDHYFQGGVTYEIPDGGDRFDLKVQPPFGSERVTVYASTAELGGLDVEEAGGVYTVKTRGADIGARTRGIVIAPKQGTAATAAEFSEATVELQTLSE